MRRLSLTSWSVHPLLQPANPASNGNPTSVALQLTDLPAKMRDAGIGTLEICHFHILSTDDEYLAQLRTSIEQADIELFSILIDTGDISQANDAKREADVHLIEGWIDVAAQLGAKVVRVIAGDAPANDPEALERSIAGGHLAGYAQERGVRVLTENFRALASTASNCNQILDQLGGDIGLCADIGNFAANSRVEEFTAVAPRAESVHAKASYNPDGSIDPAQLEQCLEASTAAGFSGPYTLVFDRPEERWPGINVLKQIVAPYTQSA